MQQSRMLESFAATALIAVLISGRPLIAQQRLTGHLAGTIYDQAGARLDHAAVTVRNTATGAQGATHPDARGEYRFENLPVGIYSVRAAARGLATVQINEVAVQVNKTSTVNVTLPNAQSTAISVVEVTQAPEPAETLPRPTPAPTQAAAAAPLPQQQPQPAVATPPQENRTPADDATAIQREIAGIRDRLALSAAQITQIHAIFQDRQTQITALRDDPSMPVAVRRERVKSVRAEAEAKFRAVLNENQLDEYLEILRERRERALERKQETVASSR